MFRNILVSAVTILILGVFAQQPTPQAAQAPVAPTPLPTTPVQTLMVTLTTNVPLAAGEHKFVLADTAAAPPAGMVMMPLADVTLLKDNMATSKVVLDRIKEKKP